MINHTNITNGTMLADSGCAGDPDVPDFWIGVFASLVGSVILNLGLNLQKYAFNHRGEKSRRTGMAASPLYKNKIWVLGFAVFVAGNFGDFVGLTFTPQSVITPIGSISLVSNLFFAKCLLGEEIGWRTLIALSFIMAGVVAIVVSSSAANPCGTEETIDTLLKRWEQGGFLTFAIIHALSLCTLLVLVIKIEHKLNGTKIKSGSGTIVDVADLGGIDAVVPALGADANAGASTKSKKTKLKNNSSLSNLNPNERFFLRFAYPLLGSLFATWTVLLSKSTGELLKSSARSKPGTKSPFSRFEVWPIIFGLIISLPCQVMYLNKGLAWFEALYIVPIFYSVWVISSIMMGALFFGEFNNFTMINFVTFFIGVFLDIVGGVMLQARGIESKDDANAEKAPMGDDKEQDELRKTFSTGRGGNKPGQMVEMSRMGSTKEKAENTGNEVEVVAEIESRRPESA
jgi:hypothetical protein